MKTSDEIKAITCTPDDVVVAFGKADNEIMQKAISDVVAMESALAAKYDAIAERDGKIRELEAMVENMKCCYNCLHFSKGNPACDGCGDDKAYSHWEIEK